MDKNVKQSITENPSDPYVSLKICSKESLNEIIKDLESKKQLTPDEKETLREAKKIWKEKFSKKGGVK